MNRTEADILRYLSGASDPAQRAISRATGYSLGLVNKTMQRLTEQQLIDNYGRLTAQADQYMQKSRPEHAIILAAGYGMRMVPINTEVTKGMVEVHGEPLIERLIKQLREVGVNKIYIVVGYMKEQYEYLIDQYDVQLVVNMDYADKNNLISLDKAASHLSNCYVVPCDLWCRDNPFSRYEFYPWYMVSDKPDRRSPLKLQRGTTFAPFHAKGKSQSGEGRRMVGIAYLNEEYAASFVPILRQMAQEEQYDHAFWEEAMLETPYRILPKVVRDQDVVEINTYEQLRELDSNSNHLNTPAIDAICEAFHIQPDQIENIQVLKKGMTNRSFLFEVNQQRYIMRIPGEGTDQLINRKEEADVYETIKNLDLCDDIIYINPGNGFKITRYVEDAHTCDPTNWQEVQDCMQVLRSFHEQHLEVDHDFDLFGLIDFYESLRPGRSIYRDYEQTKEQVMALRQWIDAQEKERTLCHIDSVCDNFLIDPQNKIRLIDWEYAGMQDPHLDVAMNCIYALYDSASIDRLIDAYFDGDCPRQTRLKIYAYIAAAGLLWSNWCEFKASLGMEFGEYALRQYRYAKEYARKVWKELNYSYE